MRRLARSVSNRLDERVARVENGARKEYNGDRVIDADLGPALEQRANKVYHLFRVQLPVVGEIPTFFGHLDEPEPARTPRTKNQLGVGGDCTILNGSPACEALVKLQPEAAHGRTLAAVHAMTVDKIHDNETQ